MLHGFHYVRSSLEIMCIALIVFSLENDKLLFTLHLICLYIELLCDSNLFKCLIAIKCSENRVETLQFFIALYFEKYSRIEFPIMKTTQTDSLLVFTTNCIQEPYFRMNLSVLRSIQGPRFWSLKDLESAYHCSESNST